MHSLGPDEILASAIVLDNRSQRGRWKGAEFCLTELGDGSLFGGFALQSMKQGIHSGTKERVGDVLLRIRDEFTSFHF